MISYNGLIELGFTPEEFELQDDSLGGGVFIKEWNSDKPIPSTTDIEQAEQVYIAEEIATKSHSVQGRRLKVRRQGKTFPKQTGLM